MTSRCPSRSATGAPSSSLDFGEPSHEAKPGVASHGRTSTALQQLVDHRNTSTTARAGPFTSAAWIAGRPAQLLTGWVSILVRRVRCEGRWSTARTEPGRSGRRPGGTGRLQCGGGRTIWDATGRPNASSAADRRSAILRPVYVGIRLLPLHRMPHGPDEQTNAASASCRKADALHLLHSLAQSNHQRWSLSDVQGLALRRLPGTSVLWS